MKKENVENEIIKVLESMGKYIEKKDDADLSDWIEDSIEFISFIVELENEFMVAFPDEYLNMNCLKSLNGLTEIIMSLREPLENINYVDESALSKEQLVEYDEIMNRLRELNDEINELRSSAKEYEISGRDTETEIADLLCQIEDLKCELKELAVN